MDYKEAFEFTYKQWQQLNWKINKVTAHYRHGNIVPIDALEELAIKQIEVENILGKFQVSQK